MPIIIKSASDALTLDQRVSKSSKEGFSQDTSRCILVYIKMYLWQEVVYCLCIPVDSFDLKCESVTYVTIIKGR